jgi:hypothetical protein
MLFLPITAPTGLIENEITEKLRQTPRRRSNHSKASQKITSQKRLAVQLFDNSILLHFYLNIGWY